MWFAKERLKVHLKALSNGAWRYLKLPTNFDLEGEWDLSNDPEGTVIHLLKWINRNRLMLDLISLKRRHLLKVAVSGNEIYVNCYVVDERLRATASPEPNETGVYLFYQKDWEDAIGASYAPFMTPIKEKGYVYPHHPKPLFSFKADLSENVVEQLSTCNTANY